jgi:predicted metal-binding protein
MASSVTTRSTSWQVILLLCGKCARGLDGGYGPDKDETLRAALRAALKKAGRHKEVRIIETRCMGICPKSAVAALNANAPGRILTVPVGTPVAEVLALLLPPPGDA